MLFRASVRSVLLLQNKAARATDDPWQQTVNHGMHCIEHLLRLDPEDHACRYLKSFRAAQLFSRVNALAKLGDIVELSGRHGTILQVLGEHIFRGEDP